MTLVRTSRRKMPAVSRPERDAGKDRVQEDVADQGGIARHQRVDDVDAGAAPVPPERELGADARPAADRQHAEPDREDELEHEAGEEHRRRVPEDRGDAQPGVVPAIALRGGQHAERDADDEGDEQRVEGELERRGSVAQDDVDDGLVVGEGGAEVAREDLAEILEVLHDDRPVEARFMDAFGELIGGEPPAERRRDRVSGRPDEHEDEGHQDEDRREDQQESHQQIAAERSALARSARCESGGRLVDRCRSDVTNRHIGSLSVFMVLSLGADMTVGRPAERAAPPRWN